MISERFVRLVYKRPGCEQAHNHVKTRTGARMSSFPRANCRRRTLAPHAGAEQCRGAQGKAKSGSQKCWLRRRIDIRGMGGGAEHYFGVNNKNPIIIIIKIYLIRGRAP